MHVRHSLLPDQALPRATRTQATGSSAGAGAGAGADGGDSATAMALIRELQAEMLAMRSSMAAQVRCPARPFMSYWFLGAPSRFWERPSLSLPLFCACLLMRLPSSGLPNHNLRTGGGGISHITDVGAKV